MPTDALWINKEKPKNDEKPKDDKPQEDEGTKEGEEVDEDIDPENKDQDDSKSDDGKEEDKTDDDKESAKSEEDRAKRNEQWLNKSWSGWTSLELSSDLVIMYQKQADSLPITTFDVTLGAPCMDSMIIASQELTSPEVNIFEQC